MDKKKLLSLAKASYKIGKLDAGFAEKVIDKLSGRDARGYLRLMYKVDRENSVVIESAGELTKEEKNNFGKLYKNKNVNFKLNPDLIFGVRITEDDMVYNLNMQKEFEDIQNHLDTAI